MQLGLWKRVSAYALVLWVIAFLVVALISALGISGRSIASGIVLLLVALVVTWIVGTRLSFVSISQGLGAGLLWIAVNAALDYGVIVIGFNGGDLSFFTHWVVWGRYLLLLVVPIALASRRHAG